MHHYRITKYNPARRDKDGAYIDWRDEWSEASDIGKVFKGTEFTLGDYLATEKSYIKAVLCLFDASGLSHLRIIQQPMDIQNRSNYINEMCVDTPHLYDPAFSDIDITDDKKVERDEIETIIKMALRGFITTPLAVLDEFYLFFGWDSYVYVETNVTAPEINTDPPIYIEDMNNPSPYMAAGPIEVLVDITYKNDELISEADTEILAHIPRLKIRDALGLSEEHPFFTHMQITPEIAEKIATLTDYKFDLEKFDYYLNTWGNER